MNSITGKWMIAAGVLLVTVGILIYFFHEKLNWMGRLPGDIRVVRENVRFYFPVTSMLLLSLLLTVVINIIRRFLK